MSERPHIAIVAHSINSGGGVGQVARAQIEHLSKRFNISVVCLYSDMTLGGVDIHVTTAPSLNWMRRFGHVWRERIEAKRLLHLLKKIHQARPINLVIYHSHACANICHRHFDQRVKSALVVHGDINTRLKGTYTAGLTRFYQAQSQQAYVRTDMIVTLSPSMKTRLLSYGVDKEKLIVIENGVEVPPNTVPDKRGDNQEKFTVLFVGRLAVEKDPATLISALSLCPEKVHLLVAGRGYLGADLRASATKLGIHSRVEFLGYLSKKGLASIYAQADALCIPSVSDSLPTVALEAMSYALPVIGTRVDGIPHMVEDGQTGLLVTAGDVQALAEAISSLANDRQAAQRMGAAGFEKLKNEFSIEKTMDKLAGAIDRTITTGSPAN